MAGETRRTIPIYSWCDRTLYSRHHLNQFMNIARVNNVFINYTNTFQNQFVCIEWNAVKGNLLSMQLKMSYAGRSYIQMPRYLTKSRTDEARSRMYTVAPSPSGATAYKSSCVCARALADMQAATSGLLL